MKQLSSLAVVITGGTPATVRTVTQDMLDLDPCDFDHCQIRHAAHDEQFFDDDPTDYYAGDDEYIESKSGPEDQHETDASN